MQLRWFSTNEMLEHHPRSQPETDWEKNTQKKIKIASYCFWTFHNDLKKELRHLLRSKIIWYK